MRYGRWLGVAVLLLMAAPLQAVSVRGRIVGVSDGDTFTLLDGARVQHKIRLIGVDALEKRQAFGKKAKSALSALAYGRHAEADCRKFDRDKRRLCVVFVGGRDIGLEQVKAGMVWWFRRYAKEQTPRERIEYEHAESQAKRHRDGLWSDENPKPPWEWRRENKKRRRPLE